MKDNLIISIFCEYIDEDEMCKNDERFKDKLLFALGSLIFKDYKKTKKKEVII